MTKRKRRLGSKRQQGFSKRWGWHWRRWILVVPITLVLPFALLVRISTWIYLEQNLNGWASVGAGTAAATLLMAAVFWIIGRRMGLQPGRQIFWLIGLVFAVYGAYLLLYVSAANVKTDAVRATYVQLHPVLRVSISSFVLLDRTAVITDTMRTPEDYRDMGLRTPGTSLHYRQGDGFVHAVDIRTEGRLQLSNMIMTGYFRLMGFSTLRHVGTADHLHVSLPVRGS